MASKKPDIEIIRTFATPANPHNHRAGNMKEFKAGEVKKNCSSKLLISLAEQGIVAKFITQESDG